MGKISGHTGSEAGRRETQKAKVIEKFKQSSKASRKSLKKLTSHSEGENMRLMVKRDRDRETTMDY